MEEAKSDGSLLVDVKSDSVNGANFCKRVSRLTHEQATEIKKFASCRGDNVGACYFAAYMSWTDLLPDAACDYLFGMFV